MVKHLHVYTDVVFALQSNRFNSNFSKNSLEILQLWCYQRSGSLPEINTTVCWLYTFCSIEADIVGDGFCIISVGQPDSTQICHGIDWGMPKTQSLMLSWTAAHFRILLKKIINHISLSLFILPSTHSLQHAQIYREAFPLQERKDQYDMMEFLSFLYPNHLKIDNNLKFVR